MRNFLIATALLASLSLDVSAQKAPPAAGKKVEVIEATVQKTRYRGTTNTTDEYRFTIIWKQSTPPGAGFYYRSGDSWKETSVTRPERRTFSQNPQDYMMVETTVEPRNVKAGDRIIITTHRHEHDEEEMPASVKAMAKKGLFFGTGTGNSIRWEVIPTKIRVLPDRTM